MPRINRKTADPEILRAYEELRFERRFPKLHVAANVIRVLAYGGVIAILFVPEGVRPSYLKVWMVAVGVTLIMEFILMVLWQPTGRRLKAFMLIFGTIGVAMLMLAGLYYGVYLLVD